MNELYLKNALPMSLHPNIGLCTRMQDLDASENWMPAVPDELAQCTALRHLNLSRNKIEALPPDLGKCTQLQTLLLSENRLASLPKSLCLLSQLTKLDVAHNCLTGLDSPGSLVECVASYFGWYGPHQPTFSYLTFLDVSHNQLASLPQWLAGLHELQHLNISHNRLTAVPDVLQGLTALQHLDASANAITAVPGSAANIKHSRWFNNRLSLLPQGFSCVAPVTEDTTVGSVDLSANALVNIDALGVLPNCDHLVLENNQLTHLPPDLYPTRVPKLKKLSLSHNRLTTLPDCVAGLTMDLNHNGLTHLPEAVLAACTKWDLRHNCIDLTRLAAASAAARIVDLDLSHNALTALPPEIGRMVKLEYLFLTNNAIETLPAEIGQLGALRRLDLRNNALTALPSQIGGCRNLMALLVRGNPGLTELPETMAQLRFLAELDADEGIEWTPPERPVPVPRHPMAQSRERTARPGLSPIDLLLGRLQDERYSHVDADAKLQAMLNHFHAPDWVCDALLEVLSPDDQRNVVEWLLRLKNTSDYRHLQRVTVVPDLLATVATNTDFRASFTAQIVANLECCGDRAAMSLNEVYTSWRLHTLEARNPYHAMALLVSGAKTFALREAVGPDATGREGVELYLKAENKLKAELELLTYSNSMFFGSMAKDGNFAAYKRHVLQHWPRHLFDMFEGSVFVEHWLSRWRQYKSSPLGLAADPDLQPHVIEEYQRHAIDQFPKHLPDSARAPLDAAMEQLEDRLMAGSVNEAEYITSMKVIQAQRDAALLALRKEWLKSVGYDAEKSK